MTAETAASTGTGDRAVSDRARRPTLRPSVVEAGRAHWAFLTVLAGFALSVLLIPTMAPVAISDDGMYSRSVEILLREGRFEVLPLSAVTQLFHTGWAALFGLVFGDDLGVFRLSTVVLTALGGWACYGLCRELGVDRVRSALGAAAYLFNPLGYVLSFTYLTDAPLTALAAIAAFGFAKAHRGDHIDWRWMAFGITAGVAALLVRQHGAIILVAMACHLVASRRVELTGRRLRPLLIVAPVVALGAYLAWINLLGGGGNAARTYTSRQITSLPTSGNLIRRLTFVQFVYPGLFVLPIAVGALRALPALARRVRGARWAVVAVWAAVLLAGFVVFGDGAMPYLQSFFTVSGLGPAGDLRGGRVAFYGRSVGVVLTAVCVLAVLVVLLGALRSRSRPRRLEDERAHLVVWLLAGQALGVMATSVNTQSEPGFSRDRYLLPLLPLAVALALWALREVRLMMPLAWAAVLAFAAYSIVGTHDSLARQEATWALADQGLADGIPILQLDAGAGWASYRLYGRSLAQGQPPPGDAVYEPIRLSASDVAGWWIPFYAPEVNSRYIVTNEPLDLHRVRRRREWSSWMSPRRSYVYLVERDDRVPG